MSEMRFGWMPSKMDGTEYNYDLITNLPIPDTYTYENYLPPVLNQGNTNMCVTYALGTHIDWNINMDNGTNKKDNNVDRKGIYGARSIPGDNGMTFKEALSYLKKNGVKTNDGIRKIDHYSKVGSLDALKQALIVNGPLIAGMIAWNGDTDFWSPKGSDKALGGHAVSIVGYSPKGIIIRNSWGKMYGTGGYAVVPYRDFDKFLECWTIID